MTTINVTDENFEDEVLNSKEPVLVDYWAPWCGPCKNMAPILDELAESMAGKVRVAKLDIDDNPEIPTQYSIRGIPTLMLFKDGEMINRHVGVMPKGQLQSWIEKELSQ